jgi:hypothetical protein
VPEITISADGLQATVTVGPRTTAKEIIASLGEAGVTTGMQTSAIVGAVGEASKSRQAIPDVVVAEGTSPRFKVPPQLLHRPRGEEETLLSLKDFKQLLEVGRPEEVLKAARGQQVLAVAAGDLLAIKESGEIMPGISVKGEEMSVIPADQIPPQFTPGRGIEVVTDGKFIAKSAGYAGCPRRTGDGSSSDLDFSRRDDRSLC